MMMNRTWLWLFFLLICGGCLGGCWARENMTIKNTAQENVSMESVGTVFRTGMKWAPRPKSSSNFAVSPDGTRIIFGTGVITDGLLLLDLKSGQKTRLPGEENRFWEMGNWSHDGQQIVAVSTAIRDNRYQVGEQEIILIDPKDWRHRKLAATPGVNICPFFSADGKSVYYLKGEKRKRGRTLATNYDLYVYDLASDRETRLTHEKMYIAGDGYDDGSEVFFSAVGFERVRSIPSINASLSIYVLNKATLDVRLLDVDQSEGVFWLDFGGKDRTGNVYFKATKKNRGFYRWFAYRCNAKGKDCAVLHEMLGQSRVRIARQTGEIFIDE
ncbi:MAG: hypothetical protein LBF50_05060, partial [Azoarcus sp.]|nr:hypothetical protein [Azoarcus sp.]